MPEHGGQCWCLACSSNSSPALPPSLRQSRNQQPSPPASQPPPPSEILGSVLSNRPKLWWAQLHGWLQRPCSGGHKGIKSFNSPLSSASVPSIPEAWPLLWLPASPSPHLQSGQEIAVVSLLVDGRMDFPRAECMSSRRAHDSAPVPPAPTSLCWLIHFPAPPSTPQAWLPSPWLMEECCQSLKSSLMSQHQS